MESRVCEDCGEECRLFMHGGVGGWQLSFEEET